MTSPGVSVLLPVRNEAVDIDACLASLAAQDYEGPLQIVVAEGGSEDATRDRLEEWSGKMDLVVVDNPELVQSIGLNLAAAAAGGEILIRADGHSVYPPDYVRRNVEALLSTGAAAVGGLMRAEGDSWFSKAVAAAMGTALVIGPGRFHHSAAAGPVDTVYLGAFRRTDFERLGTYRRFPSAVAEDADLYYRWRQAGETIWLDPAIRSTYRPRRSPAAVWRQAFRWGVGKAEMWFTNRELPYLRPLVPLALIVAIAIGLIVAAAGWWWPLGIVLASWVAVLATGALMARHPGVILVGATMHLGYGIGLLAGLMKGRRRSLPLG